MRTDEQPDLIMMSKYEDIDLNDSPIVVLGCKGRHFFTIETLDGIIGMKDVYEVNPMTGVYFALRDNEQLAASIPQCPTCREPIRQYVTQRYNRVVNRAVIDEMSKRFVVSGQQELQELWNKFRRIEQSLGSTQSKLLPSKEIRWNSAAAQDVGKKIANRYVEASHLEKNARSFLSKMAEQHKPSYKLHEAVVHATNNRTDLIESMAQMRLGSPSVSKNQDRDQRITLGGRLYHLRVRLLILNDKFEILSGYKSRSGSTDLSFPGGSPLDRSTSFLRDCTELIKDCKSASLPKLAVETTLYYAHITRLLGSSGTIKTPLVSQAAQYRESAKVLLEEAEKLCDSAFQDRDRLKEGIEQSLRLLRYEFYAEVTDEEIEAIERAMVSGRGGIASHSGHWYACINGHPVSPLHCSL